MSKKLDITRKLCYLILRNVWPLVPKFISVRETEHEPLFPAIFPVFMKSLVLTSFATCEATRLQYSYTRYPVPLYFWWIKPLLLSWKVSKFYLRDYGVVKNIFSNVYSFHLLLLFCRGATFSFLFCKLQKLSLPMVMSFMYFPRQTLSLEEYSFFGIRPDTVV